MTKKTKIKNAFFFKQTTPNAEVASLSNSSTTQAQSSVIMHVDGVRQEIPITFTLDGKQYELYNSLSDYQSSTTKAGVVSELSLNWLSVIAIYTPDLQIKFLEPLTGRAPYLSCFFLSLCNVLKTKFLRIFDQSLLDIEWETIV